MNVTLRYMRRVDMLVLPGHIFRGKEVNCMICITITVCLEMAMMDNSVTLQIYPL